jgi:hypothetical protein
LTSWFLYRYRLTHRGNDLSLETELVLEAASEVANTALAISSNVGNLANVVEHVSAGKEQDSDQADGSPEVAVLDDREEVGCGDSQECEDTDDSSRDSDDLHIVDRTLDRWVRRVGKMTAKPCVNGLGLVGAGESEVSAEGDQIKDRIETHPERKSKRVGEGSLFALGPVVGWKSRRTGAVCNCICFQLGFFVYSYASQHDIPTGRSPCHPRSPMFRTAVFLLLPCHPCSSSWPANRTQAGSRYRDHIRILPPEQSGEQQQSSRAGLW